MPTRLLNTGPSSGAVGGDGCARRTASWAVVCGAVQHAMRQLPVPFQNGHILRRKLPPPAATVGEGPVVERAVDSPAASSVSGSAGEDDLDEDEGFGCEIGTFVNLRRSILACRDMQDKHGAGDVIQAALATVRLGPGLPSNRGEHGRLAWVSVAAVVM